jgi:hypothetical protein
LKEKFDREQSPQSFDCGIVRGNLRKGEGKQEGKRMEGGQKMRMGVGERERGRGVAGE